MRIEWNKSKEGMIECNYEYCNVPPLTHSLSVGSLSSNFILSDAQNVFQNRKCY
jgi:hypothetical protein